jgi:SAM-dependent methyltransferase
MTHGATDRGVFERMYEDTDDPWGFTTSPYEARKRDITLASLPRARYRSALEPGCANGVLSVLLADRCDALLACDVAGRAVRLAERRLGPRRAVRVERREIPRDWPTETFDLIVLSEVLYFLQPDELERTMALVGASLEPGGDLVVVDWLGPIDGYPLDGEAVHARLEAAPWRRVVEHREPEFLLEVYRA